MIEPFFSKEYGKKCEEIAIKSHQLYDHNKKKGKKSSKENLRILKTEAKIITIFKIKN